MDCEVKTEPLRGKELLRAAVNQILEHPESWDQKSWHNQCGTTHCVAGWCQILGGKPPSDDAADDAEKLLGIRSDEASWLFDYDRTISDIHGFAAAFLKDEEYDRAGYNRAGYDRDGYDRDGKRLPLL